MKLNDVKHNHSLTDLLKVLLFAIVMLIPFIDVFVRCGYVMFNKNAYQSYSNVSVKENISITNASDIQIGTNYEFTTKEYNSNNSQFTSEFTYISLTANDLNVNQSTYENLNFILISPNAQYIRLSNANAPTTWLVSIPYEENIVFDIVFSRFDSGINNTIQWFYVNQITFTTEKLDNVFEYSISKIEESQLYNWTTQTAIYSGVSQMTNQLGITTNIIPIIVCYWFFITIIYIILDIVIRLFTILTHFIGSKTTN